MSRTAHIARRMEGIAPFHVMELLGRARELEAQGRTIVHMEIGEPDFSTPSPVVEAARRALAEGRTHYTPAMGLPELREAIGRFYRERYQVSVDPQRIVVTPGASGALMLALGVLIDPGDRVLLSDPGYPCNRHFVRLLEGEATNVPVDATSAFQIHAFHLNRYWDARTVAAMVATPSNPTGTTLQEPEMASLVDAVHARGGRLIVDEIYQGLRYGEEPTTALAHSDQLFVVNSFSKYFCMTGWRLGWLVVPEAYVREVEKLAQNLFIAASTLSQHAALAAFELETLAMLECYRAEFRRRRDYLIPQLQRLGFQVPVAPDGAFYLYADCSAFGLDSFQLSLRLLEEAGVAVTPGRDFGEHRAEQYVRFSYTRPADELAEGVRRMESFLGRS